MRLPSYDELSNPVDFCEWERYLGELRSRISRQVDINNTITEKLINKLCKEKVEENAKETSKLTKEQKRDIWLNSAIENTEIWEEDGNDGLECMCVFEHDRYHECCDTSFMIPGTCIWVCSDCFEHDGGSDDATYFRSVLAKNYDELKNPVDPVMYVAAKAAVEIDDERYKKQLLIARIGNRLKHHVPGVFASIVARYLVE